LQRTCDAESQKSVVSRLFPQHFSRIRVGLITFYFVFRSNYTNFAGKSTNFNRENRLNVKKKHFADIYFRACQGTAHQWYGNAHAHVFQPHEDLPLQLSDYL
jgi:hypothetical protein